MKQKYYTQSLVENISYNEFSYSPKKCKTPVEKEFETYEEAVEAAKKTVMQTKDDVAIYKIAGVAKFPIEDIKVVEMA